MEALESKSAYVIRMDAHGYSGLHPTLFINGGLFMPKEVKIVVKAVRRKEPDLRKLARALIELVRSEEEQAQAPSPSTEASS
jgi:hypothetical protein